MTHLTISTVQLTRRMIVLEGSPADLALNVDGFIPLCFHYEHGSILVYSDAEAAWGQVLRLTEDKAKQCRLGNRIRVQEV